MNDKATRVLEELRELDANPALMQAAEKAVELQAQLREGPFGHKWIRKV